MKTPWRSLILVTCSGSPLLAQLPPLALMPPRVTSPVPEAPPVLPTEKTLPINLPTALQLAGANPLDIQVATKHVELSSKAYDRAKLLWLPNIMVGADYFHHEGLQQNFAGELVKSSRSSSMVGFGPNVVFGVTDAIYNPLAARQDFRVRRASLQAVTNDVTLQVAEAYFQLQQARGELAGAMLATQKAEEVSRKAEKLAEGLAPPLEATRARVELARRRQAEAAARERRAVFSAELARILRLQADAILEPAEPAFLPVSLIDSNATLDSLIPIALTTRPELAGQQAVVQAALTRLKAEKVRPLIPSLALRSVSTNPSGSLGYGTFGGGPGGQMANFGSRYDVDVQVMWEFQQLGFGNKIRAGERKVEYDLAILEMFRTQDRVAAEVATAHAQLKAAHERVILAEPAFKDAVDLMGKSLEGMSQTRRTGDTLTLVVRPQEVVAAVQLLSQTNTDFHSAIADFNRAQFRLYRALGHPADALPGSLTK
ncbi:MAG: TolC family protein [Fimbriiglobus sp.]